MDWFANLTADLGWQKIALGIGLFAVSFFGSLGLVSFLLVRMPADYFHPNYDRAFLPDSRRAVRWGGVVVKNIAGVMLIVLGLLMSLPGVPGQGLLTILLGLVLLDFPGKQHLEQKLVRRPIVLNAVNGLRAKFDKPPLVLE